MFKFLKLLLGVTDDGSESTDCHLENQVFTLVSSGGHQFVVVSAGTDAMNISGSDALNISGTDLQQGGQSIALNIEDATRFLIQNQNMTNALMLPDGSYQILDQPMVQVQYKIVNKKKKIPYTRISLSTYLRDLA